MSYYSGIDKDTSIHLQRQWTFPAAWGGFYAQADLRRCLTTAPEHSMQRRCLVGGDWRNEIKAGFDIRKFDLSYFNVRSKRNAPYITTQEESSVAYI
jgi:hypothetical protein